MDEFIAAVKTCFSKYADFTGRASRSEFWWFVLFQFLAQAILGMVHPMLAGIAGLAMFVPGLAVGARRLHDINKSGWLMLLWLIPLIGWILLIYWAVQPSDPGPNSFGASPSGTPSGTNLAPGQQ